MSAQRPVRRAMFAICRRVFAFLVKGGTALGTVTLLVLAPITAVAHRSA